MLYSELILLNLSSLVGKIR